MHKSEYKSMYLSEEKLWWYKSLRGVLNYFIKKYASEKIKILDAGCGTGMNMVFLQSCGYDITGNDFSSDAIAFCKKRGLKKVLVGNIIKTPYASCSFNIIICLDVLGCLNTSLRKKAILEFYRLLKPNGIIIIQCAAFESLRSQHDAVVYLKKRFLRGELEKMFSPVNWKILKSSYRFFLLFPLIAAIKIVKKFRSYKTPKTDVYLPNKFINWVLFTIQKIEDSLLPYISYPWGTSIFIVAKKVSVSKKFK